ncbi:MAG: hypothetical protein WBV77_14435 [Solirubrobacteraceae bacterium]
MLDPVSEFIERYGDREHCFSDPAIEPPRRDLYKAAGAFQEREALEAFYTERDTDKRFVGVVGWEAEGDPGTCGAV